MKGAPLEQAPALLANIRLSWKGLPGTNTLAYYENSQLTVIKSFIILATDLNDFSHWSNFKPLKLVISRISADSKLSLEIESLANLRIKNLAIVNININHTVFV